MNKFFLLMSSLILIGTSVKSQQRNVPNKHEERTNTSVKLMKRADIKGTKTEPQPKGVQIESDKTTPKKLNHSKVVKSAGQSTVMQPVPATRMSSVKEKKSINYKINPELTDVDNLFNLSEEKENVNRYGKSLLNSNEYQLLNNNIVELKTKFNNYVITKGIVNCSEKEQNYYLASLKEDGKYEDYQNNIELIKGSK